ncbi:MAG: riboflavin biosynthesis protein RibF [Oscillospiraceae bacterium]|jgi:riboflavin kinase/FMN adenylyltransferase|nr:riboflavin biosynthesis protein RibF [Oscillospiraceae bacterium]
MESGSRAVALGTFDGLHLAHQAVLRAARQFEGLTPAVLLFDTHPLACLGGEAPPGLLTGAARDRCLRERGLELLSVSFARLKDLPPARFFEDILVGELRAGALCCGYHFRCGRGAAGDASMLAEFCAARGMGLLVVPRMDYQDEPISSSRIRQALADGRARDAAAMLGRPFGYALPVVQGDRLGRTLGAPTLNQIFPPELVVPRFGVYVSQARTGGAWRPSVTNIGRRPSFASAQLRSETHILDFDGDLYGHEIPVRLLAYLRPERPFADLQDLAAQIARDRDGAARYFADNHGKLDCK